MPLVGIKCNMKSYFFNSLRLSDAYICISKLTIIGSDDGLSPGHRQAIIWTNAGISLIGPLGANFSEIMIKMKAFSLTNLNLKVLSAKVAAMSSRPKCVKKEVGVGGEDEGTFFHVIACHYKINPVKVSFTQLIYSTKYLIYHLLWYLWYTFVQVLLTLWNNDIFLPFLNV